MLLKATTIVFFSLFIFKYLKQIYVVPTYCLIHIADTIATESL